MMYQLLVVMLTAGAAVGQLASLECRDGFKDVTQCFMNGMDEFARGIRPQPDADRVKACIKQKAQSCMGGGAGAGMLSGMREAAMECKDEIAPQIKAELESCMKRRYDWFEFPDVDREGARSRPGVQIMALAAVMKRAGSKCPEMKECMPEGVTEAEIRAEACRVQTACLQPYESGLKRRCKAELEAQREAVRDAVCECWQEEYGQRVNGEYEIITISTECIEDKSGRALPALIQFMLKQNSDKMMSKISEKICGEDPWGSKDFCAVEKDTEQKDAPRQSNANRGNKGRANGRRWG